MDTSRRDFIKITAGTGLGLSLGFQLTSCSGDTNITAFSPNAWLRIYPNDKTVISISKAELGQGVVTAIPRIIAEELELDWTKIEVELANAESMIPFPSMTTAGSNSIRTLWKPLLVAGASAKYMLIEAAAKTWKTNVSNCYAKEGFVINIASGERLSFGKLSSYANTLPIPPQPTLKSTSEYKLIGKPAKRFNSLDIVTGKAKYGIDTELPNLRYAAIKHAPSLGSKFVSYTEPQARPNGVQGIVTLSSAVAVVAKSYWLAQKVVDSLDIEWSTSSHTDLNTLKVDNDFKYELTHNTQLVEHVGEQHSLSALDKENVISAEYSNAFQAHVTMETMNCTVHIHENGCDVWAPTQSVEASLSTARQALYSKTELLKTKILRKLGQSDNVTIHPTLVGGGFGRRLAQDYVRETVKIAKHFNFPVKLIWSREEDIKHDFYRPQSLHQLSAELVNTPNGNLEIKTLQHKAVGASKGRTTNGAISFPYQVANRSLHFSKLDHGVPVGSWRSVSFSNHIFATESFIDELAHYVKIDPIDYRLRMLREKSRPHITLSTLKTFVNWDKKKLNNRYLGVAYSRAFGSHIAMACEIVSSGQSLLVKEFHCVVEAGIVIDPDSLKAQIEGGIIYGMNAAFKHKINIESGEIQESNFDTYPIIDITEAPTINIHLIDSQRSPGGVGEIAVPPVSPAIANAVYAASGIRLRQTPFNLTKED